MSVQNYKPIFHQWTRGEIKSIIEKWVKEIDISDYQESGEKMTVPIPLTYNPRT